MAFNNNNQNNKISNPSIIHGNGPPQPSFLQGGVSIQALASTIQQFGTNTGTLHTQLLPNINTSNRNNIYNSNSNNRVNNQQRLNTANSDNNIEQTDRNDGDDTEALRSDVKRLKHKLRELVQHRYNFKDSKTRKYLELCGELDMIYTQQYLKHKQELDTSAAKQQLKIENNTQTETQTQTQKDVLIGPNKPLGEITVLGQTLYLLSIYKLEQQNIEMAHKYIIRALMYWRCANKCAVRMGATVAPKYKTNKSLLNEILFANNKHRNNNNNNNNSNQNIKYPQRTNLDGDDVGFFWPQLVQCYIMAGNVFLKHFEYDVSSLMYRTALELCHCMEGRYHFSCIDPLEYLMTQSIMKHDIISAMIYCEEIIRILSSTVSIITKNEYKLINTKALHSCLLRLSNNKQDINNGYKLKQDCITQCIQRFGITSGHLFSLYIYFIKHCIQQSAEYMDEPLMFIEADEMINYLSNTFSLKRKLKYYEEYFLCQLFEEYLFIVSEQAIMKYGINASKNKNDNGQPRQHHHIKRLEMLYPLHMKHIDNLNRNPLSKQYNKNCTINKIKVIACYADAFEAYQDVNRANKLRQQLE